MITSEYVPAINPLGNTPFTDNNAPHTDATHDQSDLIQRLNILILSLQLPAPEDNLIPQDIAQFDEISPPPSSPSDGETPEPLDNQEEIDFLEESAEDSEGQGLVISPS